MQVYKQYITLTIFFALIFHFSFSQNIFLLEKPGTIKNYKYRENDHIRIKTISKDTIIAGIINKIGDSIIIINYANEISPDDISIIYRTRWGFALLQGIFFSAGVPYLAISTLNGVINNDSPIVSKETLIISGSLIATGIAITPLTTRKHKIDNTKWRVKILNFTD
ncbi:MAG: hypothetical protein K8R37_01105 [Bacteroidales bacterium]|nr:hypothetical protein [Bacteroidales bacterium]